MSHKNFENFFKQCHETNDKSLTIEKKTHRPHTVIGINVVGMLKSAVLSIPAIALNEKFTNRHFFLIITILSESKQKYQQQQVHSKVTEIIPTRGKKIFLILANMISRGHLKNFEVT